MVERKMKKKIIGILIFTLFIATFVPAVESLETSAINSTKNEIASSNLPHWLDGTILDGNHRVITTPNGKPPRDTTPSDYDYVISYAEYDAICAKARQDYVQRYDIDPCQKSATEQTKEQQMQQSVNDAIASSNVLPRPLGDDPYPNFRILMYLKVYFAVGSQEPDNIAELKKQTNIACSRFWFCSDQKKPYGHLTFLLHFVVYYYSGYWDPTGYGYDTHDILDSLYLTCKTLHTNRYTLFFGWIKRGDDANGRCCQHWFYGVGVETRHFGEPWYNLVGKDVIVQHELTHMIGNIPDGATHSGDCLMDYFDAETGCHIWCSNCVHAMWKHL
jgi:hypothetical protein